MRAHPVLLGCVRAPQICGAGRRACVIRRICSVIYSSTYRGDWWYDIELMSRTRCTLVFGQLWGWRGYIFKARQSILVPDPVFVSATPPMTFRAGRHRRDRSAESLLVYGSRCQCQRAEGRIHEFDIYFADIVGLWSCHGASGEGARERAEYWDR